MAEEKKEKRPGTFKKGDVRINRSGRPKSFDALRKLALAIAHEVPEKDGLPVVINGHKATVAEIILRKWAASGNHQLQKAFVEIAFGKVPDNINVKSDGTLLVSYVNDWRHQEEDAATD